MHRSVHEGLHPGLRQGNPRIRPGRRAAVRAGPRRHLRGLGDEARQDLHGGRGDHRCSRGGVAVTRVAIYARVSTDRQESLNQIAELREFAERKGWEIAAEYIDEVVSGKQTRQPQLERLLRDAHHGGFQLDAFWSLDRLTRDRPDAGTDI